MQGAKLIVVTRFVTVEVWSHAYVQGDPHESKDVVTYHELVPGQLVRVRGRMFGCFRLIRGWTELPDGSWRWAD